MYAPYQIPRPDNWQDFEILCWAIWKEEWNTSSLKKNGRNGQDQDGIDICGRPDDGIKYRGIQCKCKPNNKPLKFEEIKNEVNHAKDFEPKIDNLVIATTYDNDAKLEEEVRKLSQENVANELFTVDLFGWQDIETLLERHTNVRDWYLNLSMKKSQSCSFKADISTLVPSYLRRVYTPSVTPEKDTSVKPYLITAHNETIYGNRCKIGFIFTNTCDYSMSDVIIKCWANDGLTFHRMDRDIMHYMSVLNPDDPVFVEDEFVRFKASIVHPTDNRYFECFIEIPHGLNNIDLCFKITAKDFVDEQHVYIDILPQYTTEELPNNKTYHDTEIYEPLITYK